MSLTGNSHPIVTGGSRFSRAPPHCALPEGVPDFLNRHGMQSKKNLQFIRIEPFLINLKLHLWMRLKNASLRHKICQILSVIITYVTITKTTFLVS